MTNALRYNVLCLMLGMRDGNDAVMKYEDVTSQCRLETFSLEARQTDLDTWTGAAGWPSSGYLEHNCSKSSF